MADFRKLAKENPLKPGRVAIPQLDPLTDIKPEGQEPKQARSSDSRSSEAAQVDDQRVTASRPEAEDLETYKSKYLHKEEEKVTKTFRMYRWRYEQLEREVRDAGLSQWQIIDVGLEMYFRDKQGGQSD